MFTNKESDDVSITEAPYGGRLTFVMPEGNMLYIHLKDKSLIRNKKRWSQVQNCFCAGCLQLCSINDCINDITDDVSNKRM